MSNSESTVSSSERYTGRVKWFNNKENYGFITITDGPKSGTDVFVHFSAIRVQSEQYKYLVQGEYVDFCLSDTKTADHEFQADEVRGIKGGKLMCETRYESRVARTQYRTVKPELEPVAKPAPRARGAGPRDDVKDWSHVSSPKKSFNERPIQGRGDREGGRGGRGRGRPFRRQTQEQTQS